jgi:exodeoxyribonuclease V alpha subunit
MVELLRALPSLAVERGEIDKSPPKPLVYDVAAGCVYLRKQFLAERRVAEGVKARSSKEGVAAPEALAMIAKVFPLYEAPPPGEPDLQKEAALAVASKSFAIVTGGPGTGKTTSVAAALCALLAGNPGLRVGLAAPTGKAASQVLTSIAAQRGLLAKRACLSPCSTPSRRRPLPCTSC